MTLNLDTAAAVPADVAAAAAARDLGAHRESYPAKTVKVILFALGTLAVIFGGLAVVMTLVAAGAEPGEGKVGATPAIIMWVIAVPLLAGFVFALVRSPAVSKQARLFQVHVFERGFVWVRRSGTQVYRWDEVQTLFAATTRVNNNGIVTTTYDYRIACADGRQTRIREVHTDMKRFGPLLSAEVAQAQLPKAMSFFDKGNPVAFGDLTVTEGGVTTRRGKLVPWSELGGVEVNQGFLNLVDRNGKKASPRVAFGRMPNAHAFLMMVETILTKLRSA
ncbi:hypothetical protein Cme02nite_19840 [Catellatospora methionotrophica]|uniref:Uncharacterized protein n=1 Tax=Catellatospora methionotrophica TaxID=121620 RepID=A0A8J3PE08_9ACTN|nr:DUF6585 family protein [Catellatospora methionotrophica]GIG13652.1 hypothetical protein Cme02nite_19840 [Catellatospora methionotrophica]